MPAPSFDVMRRALLVVGALAMLAGIVNVAAFDWTSHATAGTPYDFDLNWVAAQRLVDREPLYDREASRAEGLKLVGPEMLDTNHGAFSSYIGLPSTALFYVPFTPLDASTEADLFRLVDTIAMFAAVAVVVLALPGPSRLPAGLIGFGAMLLSMPVNKSIFLGQVDGFLMLGLAVALFGVSRGRWGIVGIGLGVAALLKLSPALLILYLALRGKWRAVWFALGTMAALLTVAALIGRPGDLVEWVRHVAPVVGRGSRIVDNQSLPAALARLFGGSDDVVSDLPLGDWRFLSYAIGLAGVLCLWLLRRRRPVEPLDLGVLVLVALLAGPVSWDHYSAWSILVLVLVVDPVRYAGRPWPETALLFAGIGAATLLNRIWTSYPLPPEVASNWLLRPESSTKTVALLLLLAVSLRLLLGRVTSPEVLTPGAEPGQDDDAVATAAAGRPLAPAEG